MEILDNYEWKQLENKRAWLLNQEKEVAEKVPNFFLATSYLLAVVFIMGLLTVLVF